MNSKIDSKKLVFSCLSGYNFYHVTQEIVDPSGCKKTLAIHQLNDTDVEIRFDTALKGVKSLNRWKYFIEHPVDITNILWPVDIIKDEDQYGLVFRRRAFPALEPLKKLLYNDMKLDWRQENIQKLILGFLNLCQNIHTHGYAYHCFDMERMYYNPKDMSLLFDFSLSMARTYDQLHHEETIGMEDVGIEFLPLWHDMDHANKLTLADDYHAITVILFRMMVGRMPYQGRLMDGIGDMMNLLRDVDENSHVNMFRQYREKPVFIFDPEDQRNAIGLFDDEQDFIDRWEALPANVREMFTKVLCGDNIRRDQQSRISCSTEEWIGMLTQCFQIGKEQVER